MVHTAFRAARIAYARIIASAAVGAELGVCSERIHAGGSEALAGTGHEGIAALTHLEERAGDDDVAGQHSARQGGGDEEGGEGE